MSNWPEKSEKSFEPKNIGQKHIEKKTKIEKHLKTVWSLKLQKLRFHMKNKLKMSKQGKLGKTNLKLQNKGHGRMRKK